MEKVKKFTTINMDLKWLQIYFSQEDSLTSRVISAFANELLSDSEVDYSTLSPELLPYFDLEYQSFKSTFKNKRDVSTRVTILPSLLFLLEDDSESELNKFLFALHNYKLTKTKTRFTNKFLTLLFERELKTIDKYRKDEVETTSFDSDEVTENPSYPTEFDTEDLPTEEEFYNPEPFYFEEPCEGTQELNDITGSVRIDNIATPEEIEEIINEVQEEYKVESTTEDELWAKRVEEMKASGTPVRTYERIKAVFLDDEFWNS